MGSLPLKINSKQTKIIDPLVLLSALKKESTFESSPEYQIKKPFKIKFIFKFLNLKSSLQKFFAMN